MERSVFACHDCGLGLLCCRNLVWARDSSCEQVSPNPQPCVHRRGGLNSRTPTEPPELTLKQMASNAQKLSAAAEFINDAPPGEMNEVLGGTSLPSTELSWSKDIRTILEKESDHEFAPALGKYNTEQLTTFKTKDDDRRVYSSRRMKIWL